MTAELCKCHGEPMYWVKDSRYSAGGFWRCAATHRARRMARYYALEGVAYNWEVFKNRRDKALRRMRKRHRLPEEA
jgi:hypothetical protein